ncbi:hypothetical protein [Pseudoroseicyclus aestuarii]|uniref:Tat pathway signal sequence domain protein n=1 Tax=Pseudoroseicyclus aestuarii TaxID=1795041 RepID=A0A318T3Q9_9RHOB|nr:hypothetical protein [Pseudoroseicyclus aestuarii]PYE84874.1 hypothetical protein DFP88_102678 [Pseudoroseicyclus aestuarii]
MTVTRPGRFRLAASLLAALATALALPAAAQDTEDAAPEPALSVELNAADAVEGSCRLTFLVRNDLGADLSSLALETVVLTGDGAVERLTLFDFRELPQDRPRVRQFDLAGLDCADAGQVLINGVSSCDGAGLEPGACMAGLALSSRTEIGLIG